MGCERQCNSPPHGRHMAVEYLSQDVVNETDCWSTLVSDCGQELMGAAVVPSFRQHRWTKAESMIHHSFPSNQHPSRHAFLWVPWLCVFCRCLAGDFFWRCFGGTLVLPTPRGDIVSLAVPRGVTMSRWCLHGGFDAPFPPPYPPYKGRVGEWGNACAWHCYIFKFPFPPHTPHTRGGLGPIQGAGWGMGECLCLALLYF